MGGLSRALRKVHSAVPPHPQMRPAVAFPISTLELLYSFPVLPIFRGSDRWAKLEMSREARESRLETQRPGASADAAGRQNEPCATLATTRPSQFSNFKFQISRLKSRIPSVGFRFSKSVIGVLNRPAICLLLSAFCLLFF